MKFNHAEKGQSLVELALSLLLILTLLAGAVDLGSAFFSYIAVRDAAQEGALYGSIDPLNTGAIVSRVRGASGPPGPPKPKPVDLYDLTKVTVSVTTSTTPCSGGWVTVSVSYNYQLTMPLIGAIIGRQTIPLTASATDTILIPSCP
ncbi:MAG: pilus assembly protein [Anaerolineales bacterium]|nr:pilus assembly protein [Anaerolineales bacterium]